MISSCSSSQSCFFHFVPERFKINMYSLQANVCEHILVSPQFTGFLELPLCESRTNVRTNFIQINPPTFQPCMQTWCNLFFFFKLDRIQTEERICYQQPKNDSAFFFHTRVCEKPEGKAEMGIWCLGKAASSLICQSYFTVLSTVS